MMVMISSVSFDGKIYQMFHYLFFYLFHLLLIADELGIEQVHCISCYQDGD